MPVEVLEKPKVLAQEVPQKERLLYDVEFTALHTRILLGGDALNPANRNLPEVTKKDITEKSIDDRDYKAFEKGSREQRRAFWEGKGDFDEQKIKWIQDTVKTFHDGSEFFTKSDRGQKWVQVFDRLGINAKEFSEKDALHLYDKYLSGTSQDQKSKQFVKDIIQNPNYTHQDLDAVSWIGSIFGVNPQSQEVAGANEVIVDYVYVEKQVQDNPDAIVALANETHPIPIDEQGNTKNEARRNIILPLEERKLNFLWDGANLQETSVKTQDILVIKEKSPQTPEVPWDQWLGQLQERFQHWRQEEKPSDPNKWEWPPKMPNLPEQHKRIWTEIPSDYEQDIVDENKKIRNIKGESTTGVFYRPGIGYGGALHEVLDKMGTYGTMVVSDPVYEGKEMVGWSEGLLPIDYYVRALNLIYPQDLRVALTNNYRESGKIVSPEQYELAEIPAGGMATIDFKVNGVNLTLHLLAEDMTKFSPDRYDTLGLGRPTPYNHDKAKDPRYSKDFKVSAMQNLATGGIIDYHEGNFSFLPSALPPEVFGFKTVYSKDTRRIVQKNEDVGERLQGASKTVQAIHEALGVLAGYLPGENGGDYYKSLNKYREEGQSEITLEDVINRYNERLIKIAQFIATLPDEIQDKTLKRLEFLFMNPIATNGKIDVEKVKKIDEAPEDPDNPKPVIERYAHYPYFGRPQKLINDSKAGNIDLIDYYNKVIDKFYTAFTQLRHSN